LSPDAAFPDEAETTEAEGSTGVLRLSMERRALVCACCTVMGEVACEEKGHIATVERGPLTRTHLLERMARHGWRVNVGWSDRRRVRAQPP